MRGSNCGGKLVSGYLWTATQDNRPLNYIGELAHVAWPIMGDQFVQSILGDPVKILLRFQRKPRHEKIDEVRNIFPSLSQRRKRNGNYVETVIKIRAEASLFNRFIQVAIRRGDDFHVDLDGFHPSYALKLSLLEKPQELGLNLGGNIADLIEENRSAMG